MGSFSEAQAYYQAGRYDEAIRVLTEFVTAEPTNEPAWRMLGACHFQQRQYPETEGALRRCTQLAPDDAAVWTNLGVAIRKQRRWAEARECLDCALRLDPNSTHAREEIEKVNARDPALASLPDTTPVEPSSDLRETLAKSRSRRQQRERSWVIIGAVSVLGLVLLVLAALAVIGRLTAPPPSSPPAWDYTSGTIHDAVLSGNANAVQVLLRQGVSANVREPEVGNTPLHTAAMCGNASITRLLIRSGAATDAENDDGETALHCVGMAEGCDWGTPSEVARLLLDSGADPNSTRPNGWTPLHAVAVGDDDADTVVLLLRRGARVNAMTANRETPLYYAAINGQIEAARVLLRYGADVNARSAKGWTPVHCAKVGGHAELMALLKQHGAEE